MGVRNQPRRWVCAPLILAATFAGCGGASPAPRHARGQNRPASRGGTHAAGSAGTTSAGPVKVVATRRPRRHPVLQATPLALVTAETENRLVAVDLRNGRVIRRIAVAADPEDIASCGDAVVVSPAAGTVSLFDPQSLHVVAVLPGFGSPHIAACSPDGEYAAVTDDARGTLSVIEDLNRRVVARISVGAGAHHMAFSPDQRRLWIALGESARTIVMVDTSDITHPRVVGRLDPGFPVHDLSFSPDGRRVWLTSATGPDVAVFNAATRRPLFRVAVGPPPQHLVFAGGSAYVTSGYGNLVERVATADGRILQRVRAPHGSFELAAGDGHVVTSSLLLGEVTVYDGRLHRERVLALAPATREVALATRWTRWTRWTR